MTDVTIKSILAGAVLIATGALAHQGVQNADVMARMHVMGSIAGYTKVLGDMAKGSTGFDTALAREAAGNLATDAADIPGLFASEADDPKSEARPNIWTSFDDFTARAEALEAAALSAASGITDLETLRQSMQAIGQTCQSCHAVYRLEN